MSSKLPSSIVLADPAVPPPVLLLAARMLLLAKNLAAPEDVVVVHHLLHELRFVRDDGLDRVRSRVQELLRDYERATVAAPAPPRERSAQQEIDEQLMSEVDERLRMQEDKRPPGCYEFLDLPLLHRLLDNPSPDLLPWSGIVASSQQNRRVILPIVRNHLYGRTVAAQSNTALWRNEHKEQIYCEFAASLGLAEEVARYRALSSPAAASAAAT